MRDRHEVLEADVKHLPTLYSDREELSSSPTTESVAPVHRSFPPSPATVRQFVNRGPLLNSLWDWFVFGDQPRLYLHGPGGSGKSTLAFEFARMLAESRNAIRGKNGDRLDYVIYISGKETELLPVTGKQQTFALRQFASATEQYRQILHHSGVLKPADFESADDHTLDALMDELFANFSGLIVLDDIDALSRRGQDTGEETLFMKSVLAQKRTRILYTLRFPPTHALGSSLAVPGLEPSTEFIEFLKACCGQFGVPAPPVDQHGRIQEATSRLPLLIETIVGLRKNCSNYPDAVHLFLDRGGSEARRYLYQREYDRLDSKGKARQLLAGLLPLEEPVNFATIADLFQFTRDQVREALTECSSVFLSTFDAEFDTLYQLTPPCVPFIKSVSEDLTYFKGLQVKVRHFKTEGRGATPEEAAVIVKMQELLRSEKFPDVVSMGEAIPKSDAVFLNPKIRSLMGQAYAEMGPNYRERARDCFKYAEGLGYRDLPMMRRWFTMEFLAGYGLTEAERICRVMIEDQRNQPRARSEFWSKLGQCNSNRANALLAVNREKGFDHLRRSIVCYLEGLYVGAGVANLDTGLNLSWLERPLHRLVAAIVTWASSSLYLKIWPTQSTM